MNEATLKQQIFLSGVGGQGILFITRLLAEAAMLKGLPVLVSETHGMAQRGGTVVSHLKAGDFSSPLIRPGRADGLVLLKEENLSQHCCYLKPGGWAVVNAPSLPEADNAVTIHAIDADSVAKETGNARSVNLILLGFAAARCAKAQQLFCSADELIETLERRLSGRDAFLRSARAAFAAGYERGGRP